MVELRLVDWRRSLSRYTEKRPGDNIPEVLHAIRTIAGEKLTLQKAQSPLQNKVVQTTNRGKKNRFDDMSTPL